VNGFVRGRAFAEHRSEHGRDDRTIRNDAEEKSEQSISPLDLGAICFAVNEKIEITREEFDRQPDQKQDHRDIREFTPIALPGVRENSTEPLHTKVPYPKSRHHNRLRGVDKIAIDSCQFAMAGSKS